MTTAAGLELFFAGILAETTLRFLLGFPEGWVCVSARSLGRTQGDLTSSVVSGLGLRSRLVSAEPVTWP